MACSHRKAKSSLTPCLALTRCTLWISEVDKLYRVHGLNSHRLLKLLQIIRELIDACEISDDVSS
jgi:hypothetical protein